MLKKTRIFLILIFATNFGTRANINNLRDTLTILKPEYYEYSVIHGAFAWEKDWVMNVWDLGWERKKADAAAGEKKDELINAMEAPALVRVVDRMFHRPTGTVGRMNFTPTEEIKKIPPTVVAELLAVVIGFDSINSICEELLILSKELNGKIKKLNLYTALFSKKNGKLDLFKINTNDLAGINKGCLQLKLDEKMVKAKRFVNLVKFLFSFKKACSALFLGGAYGEDLFKSFGEYTAETRMVLLASLWYCCKDDKDLLKTYYLNLNKCKLLMDNKSIFGRSEENSDLAVGMETITFETEPNWEDWANSRFDAKTRDIVSSEISQKFSEFERWGNIFIQNPDLYEKLIWTILLPGRFPKISGSKMVSLWYGGQRIEPCSFPDCMDGTMMNFLCVLAYNPESQSFDIEYLKKKIDVSDINHKLMAFFAGDHPAFEKKLPDSKTIRIIPSPENIENKAVHCAWTEVVANIPGVAYNRLFKNDIESSATGRGFVFVQDQHKALVRAGYLPVVNEGICFELQPTIKNFIVLLNYLLNLNLFDTQNVYAEILRSDFIKAYLPILSAKLKVRLVPDVSFNEIDAKDFSQTILTNLFFEGGAQPQFKLSTSHFHGELISVPSQYMSTEFLNKVIKGLSTGQNKDLNFQGIVLSMMTAGMFKNPKLYEDNFNYFSFFWLTNYGVNNILNAFGAMNKTLSDESVHFFMNFANDISDESQKLWFYSNIVKILKADSVFWGKFITEMQKALGSKGIEKFAALTLFIALVNKGYVFDEETFDKVVSIGMSATHEGGYITSDVFDLFNLLIELKKRISDVLNFARFCATSHLYFDDRIYDLFTNLIRHGYEIDGTVSFAQKGIKSGNSVAQKAALNLFAELVKKGEGIEEALVSATFWAEEHPGDDGIGLYNELLTRGNGFPKLIQVVVTRMKKGNFLDEALVNAIINNLNMIDKDDSKLKNKLVSMATMLVDFDQSLSANLLLRMLELEIMSQEKIIDLIETMKDRDKAKAIFIRLKHKFKSGKGLDELNLEFGFINL